MDYIIARNALCISTIRAILSEIIQEIAILSEIILNQHFITDVRSHQSIHTIPSSQSHHLKRRGKKFRRRQTTRKN